jgi:hypothetical protein
MKFKEIRFMKVSSICRALMEIHSLSLLSIFVSIVVKRQIRINSVATHLWLLASQMNRSYSFLKAKFYWFFMLSNELVLSCSGWVQQSPPTLHRSLLPKTLPFVVLTWHLILPLPHFANETFSFSYEKVQLRQGLVWISDFICGKCR